MIDDFNLLMEVKELVSNCWISNERYAKRTVKIFLFFFTFSYYRINHSFTSFLYTSRSNRLREK
jgi:hypothetical protein